MSFNDAQRINDQDPLVYNEIGVVFYKQKQYEQAKDQLSRALSLCHESTNNSSTYETILLNLAHC
jgi:anaphase-promoting complex subunit 6